MMKAVGYAVVENDVIQVKSVSPTRRGALVNFLLTDRRHVVLNHHTDAAIEAAWTRLHADAEVVEVRIEVVK